MGSEMCIRDSLLAACGLGRNTSHFDAYVAKYMDGAKVPKISSKKAGNKGKNKGKSTTKPTTKAYQDAVNYMYSLKGKYVDFDKMYGLNAG